MKKNLYETEYIEIFIDPDVPMLCDHWLGDVDKEEFQTTIKKQFVLFKEYKKEYKDLQWCNDFRGIHHLDFLDDKWLLSFYKKLLSEDIQKIAFIVPGFLYYQMDQKDTQKMVSNSSICYFDEYEAAVEWLQK